MGLERARPALRLACATAAGGLLVTALAAPASAQDPTPTPDPTTVSTLAPPSQEQIDDAKNALNRLRAPRPAAPATPTTTIAQVAGPIAPRRGSVASRISDEEWWTLGAGALVLLVLSETTRITARRAKHRKGA